MWLLLIDNSFIPLLLEDQLVISSCERNYWLPTYLINVWFSIFVNSIGSNWELSREVKSIRGSQSPYPSIEPAELLYKDSIRKGSSSFKLKSSIWSAIVLIGIRRRWNSIWNSRLRSLKHANCLWNSSRICAVKRRRLHPQRYPGECTQQGIQ